MFVPQLSVIIITLNEASNIVACLQSVSFADQIIVLDAGSSDDTVALAYGQGAQVHMATDWPGFGPQKNRVLALASGEWVLSIDADERVTPELREEMLVLLSSAPAQNSFSLPRLSSYCGQFMRHSGWFPDFVPRLFRRGCAHFSDDLVHERLLTQGAVGQLKSTLLHLSFPDFESVLGKVNRYSTAGAQSMAQTGRTANLWSAVGHALWAFMRTYILRRGFLDGQLGLALAISNAEGTYYRYVKRWLMQRQQASKSGGSDH